MIDDRQHAQIGIHSLLLPSSLLDSPLDSQQITGQIWFERALFFCDHHSAMGHFPSAQMTETKLIRKLAPKHFFMSKIEIRNSNLNVATTKTTKSRFHIQHGIFISKIESVYFFRVHLAREVPMH